MKLSGKTVVVTGGGNGVGREIALQLIRKGANVAIADINLIGMQETFRLSGNSKQLSIHHINITQFDEVEGLVIEVIKRFGSVDVLINNAGIIQPFVSLSEMEYEVIERVMNVNYYGTLYMVKAFMPELLKRSEAHIVNISSMGGFLPVPGQSIYGASKAAVKLMTEALMSELAETNIKVSLIVPGAMATDIKKNSNLEVNEAADIEKAGNILTPQVSAARIIKAIEMGKKRLYLGKDSKMMNFLYRVNEQFASNLIRQVMHANGH